MGIRGKVGCSCDTRLQYWKEPTSKITLVLGSWRAVEILFRHNPLQISMTSIVVQSQTWWCALRTSRHVAPLVIRCRDSTIDIKNPPFGTIRPCLDSRHAFFLRIHVDVATPLMRGPRMVTCHVGQSVVGKVASFVWLWVDLFLSYRNNGSVS